MATVSEWQSELLSPAKQSDKLKVSIFEEYASKTAKDVESEHAED